MNRVLNFCINTNIFVALGSFSLYKVSELLFNFQDHYLGLFVFFSTLFAYNYMRSPLLFSFKKQKKSNSFILLFSGAFVVFISILLGLKFIKLILPALIISCFYPLSIRVNKKEYGIRKVFLLKVFLIAFTWSYVTLLVPLLYYDFAINYFLIDSFFQRILFVIAISIPFDIRDVHYDDIKTLPNTIGIYESKLFAWFCLFIIDILLIIDLINNDINFPFFIALFCCIELCSIIIYFSNITRSYIFYGILVESLPIIMYVFLLIGSIF